MKWTANDIPDLTGKTAIVTGANSGLGFETTKALAAKGAKVIMACRNQKKAEDAALTIREEVPNAQVQVHYLDLSNLDTVQDFAAKILPAHHHIDILINNAGLVAIPYCKTAQGFEMQFGTNHLGHFALTASLATALLAAPAARIVNVSSLTYSMARLNFQNLNGEQSYARWKNYGASKLCNLLFAQELDRRLRAKGHPARAMIAHPGYAATAMKSGDKPNGKAWETSLFVWTDRIFAQSQLMGALPQLFAATAPQAQGGTFYGPNGWMNLRGYPAPFKFKTKVCPPEDAAQLWTLSEQLSKIPFPI